MEPNTEKIFQQKIREAEQRPVYWQKDTLWLRMDMKPRRSHRHLYLAIAASFMLIAVTGIYSYRHLTGKYEALIVQGAAPKKQPNKLEAVVAPHAPLEKSIAILQPAEDQSKKIKPAENIAVTVAIPVHESIVDTQTASIPTVATVDSVAATEQTQTPRVAEEKKIRPIVGVIPAPEQQPLATHREKKTKFRILRTQKDESPIEHTEESKLVIARIN
ncbi:MAG TPA: hypothetical protein VIN08_14090 [Ohtaekwangia sp.]|uniref:hypothetical protein n=1 Tax=Ohtaekwangia sp. TaxID=2066019 RepID=UPI002F935757